MAEKHSICLIAVAVVLVVGCRTAHQVRDVEYAGVLHSAQQAWVSVDPAADAVSPVFSDLEGQHTVGEYIQFALDQNPDIQAARKRVEAFAHQVPVAASLQDPSLSLTFLPEQIQTAAGQQEFSLSANQKLPWRGKLAARAEVAELQANVARAQLAAVELETIEQVKRAYYELYFVQQAIGVTEAEEKLLGNIRNVADARYRSGKASQQDVLRADLEISNVENQLIRLRQQLASSQARLARLLHVAPQTKVRAVQHLAQEELPRDMGWLQRRAVAARPELHAQLAELQRDRQVVELARLDYVPDVTLGATWIDIANAGVSPVRTGKTRSC